MTIQNKIIFFISTVALGLVITTQLPNKIEDVSVGAFNATRGFLATQIYNNDIVSYEFGAVNIPTERAGLASGSGGFELGKFLVTDTTAFTVASTTTGFAFTVNKSGKIRGCAFDLQTLPTTGTVSIQIQKNGTLQTGKYCKLPRAATFAVNGGNDDMSSTETITDEITFVAGDRFGLIASSSNLNAATVDGTAKLILQLNN